MVFSGSSNENGIEQIRQDLIRSTPTKRRRTYEAFALAALGSIPWVGGFMSAAASLKFGEDEIKRDSLHGQWLEEHTTKLRKLQETLEYIITRLEGLGDEVDKRIESSGFLDIVRKAFRTWDSADTDEKRKYVADLIANSSTVSLTSDDVVRLFIEWLNKYHEAHFAVIREIYAQPGITRAEIWGVVHGDFPREDSAEADLFRMLIRDLSTGGVIRQQRETTAGGEFLKRPRQKSYGGSSPTMESAFEETKPYVLTALGEQFVHYTMTEVVPRVDSGS
jgi:hypothetical protein